MLEILIWCDGPEGSQFSFIFLIHSFIFDYPVLFFYSTVLLLTPKFYFLTPQFYFLTPQLYFLLHSFIFSLPSFHFCDSTVSFFSRNVTSQFSIPDASIFNGQLRKLTTLAHCVTRSFVSFLNSPFKFLLTSFVGVQISKILS